MRILFIGAGLLLLVALSAALFVRLAPVSIADVRSLETKPPGDYRMAGGHHAVRPLETVDLAALEARIAETVRTRALYGSAGNLPMVFVHRSAFWGFPDVTQVWVGEGNVHVYSHLVYGTSDLGVNRKRMKGWFASLGL